MNQKPLLTLWNIDSTVSAREMLLKEMLADDDYTIRLWNAEAKLLELGFKREEDGIWRKKITPDELKELQQIKKLGFERNANEENNGCDPWDGNVGRMHDS